MERGYKMTLLQILSASELKTLKDPPEFNSEERKYFFYLPKWAEKYLETLRKDINKIGFVLQLGYFRAVKKNFIPSKYHKKDIEYVTNKLNIPFDEVDISKYHRVDLNRNKNVILKNLGFQTFNDEEKKLLIEKANSLIARQLKPKLILSELMDFLIKKKIEVPGYFTLAEIITLAINNYEKKLMKIIIDNITSEQKDLLNTFLEFEEKIVSQDKTEKGYRYNLTLFKKFEHSIRRKFITGNVYKLKKLRQLYYKLEEIVKTLNLSPEIIGYYANIVSNSKSRKIYERKEERKFLYLISFIINYYYKLHDHLVDVLLRVVKNIRNSSQRETEKKYFEERKERAKKEIEIIEDYAKISTNYFEIKKIIKNKNWPDEFKVKNIELLYLKNPVEIKTREELDNLRSSNSKALKDRLKFEVFDKNSRKLHYRASNIITNLLFNQKSSNNQMLQAIEDYKNDNFSCNSIEFLPDDEQDACSDNSPDGLNKSLYRTLLFFKIADDIKSGALNLEHSYKYRSFDDYLIPKEIWKNKKEEYLKKADLNSFKDVNTLLRKLRKTLDDSYRETNFNIINKVNKYVRFDKNNDLIITTPGINKEEANTSVTDLFPKKNYIPLSEILATTNKFSGFLDAFQHWSFKYNKRKPSDKTFFAALIAYGCNIGKDKIAGVSRNINEYELENTINWYFTEENVDTANDKILTLENRLLLPDKLKQNPNITHTSSDGQKYSVEIETLNADYSFKYFGKGKGVSAYNFIDDRHFLFHSTVISSSEREAAYVIDGLLHNNIVKSDIHSTDTHGYTELVFAASHLLGFSFAPRIKNVKKQLLYSFINKKDYKKAGWKILPDRYINTKIIQENWDDILRFICTIKLKEATASQLFKRLSYYSKNHPLYTAIKAFGQIIKTIFILKFIDDVEFRQAITKQLNISELTNKFSKAVFYGNNQEFNYETKEEQIIAESCKRLIKNAIICWNYLYLSKLLTEADEGKKEELINIIKNGSMQVWKHVNFQGEFDFSDEKLLDSVGFKFPKILALSIP